MDNHGDVAVENSFCVDDPRQRYKVKVNGQWEFCPAIIESSGRLKDRIRSNGHTEIHPEGVYYIEWRENGQRRRRAVPNRNEVLEQARLKAFELESARMGAPTASRDFSLGRRIDRGSTG